MRVDEEVSKDKKPDCRNVVINICYTDPDGKVEPNEDDRYDDEEELHKEEFELYVWAYQISLLCLEFAIFNRY